MGEKCRDNHYVMSIISTFIKFVSLQVNIASISQLCRRANRGQQMEEGWGGAEADVLAEDA